MVNVINQKKDLSGQVYVYDECIVDISDFFIYEISIHKYWKNGYCLLGTRLYKSNKTIKLKRIYKRCNNYILEKEISLVSAPYEFIKNYPKLKRKRK